MGSIDGSSVPSPVVLSSPTDSILSTEDLILRLGDLANPISKEEEKQMTPEDFAKLPIITKKGNIVEAEERKIEGEGYYARRQRLANRRRIRSIESETANILDFDVDEYAYEVPSSIKTVEQLPDWLEGIMDADWTAVVPNYVVSVVDRPKTGDKLLDVIEKKVELFNNSDARDELGMPLENYTKYNVLESNLDLVNLVGKDWKSKMRLNLRAIQRKQMRNQPYKKDIPKGERTLPEETNALALPVEEEESSEEEY